ncbi:MAG: glucose-6-phosphate dehydrogenase assembly protein OpcA [Oscillochloridaceae bacterium umkhey_bin13]
MIAIEIATIERELAQLWREGGTEASTGQALTRALTLNLVARATDTTAADQIGTTARELAASHPSRTILAVLQPGASAPQLEAFVEASCPLVGPGMPQVCGEQVTLYAQGAATAQVASLILALLVPDLPVALWLPGPAPLADPLLPRLRGVLDRLIVDSRSFTAPARGLVELAAWELAALEGGGSAAHPALSDLAWAALTPWRELLAQFFDTRALLPHLHRIDEVQLDYLAAPLQEARPNPVPALLMAGWLAAALGWVPLDEAVSVEGDRVRLHLRRPAVDRGPGAIRLVSVELCPVAAPAGSSPGLAAIRLRAVDGQRAEFRVDRAELPGHARTTAFVAGHEPLSRVARCEEPSLAELLAAELRLRSRDRTFAAALRVAARFAARLG